jgi:hypothetical protein
LAGEKGRRMSEETLGDAKPPFSGDATRECSGGEDWYGAKSMARRFRLGSREIGARQQDGGWSLGRGLRAREDAG